MQTSTLPQLTGDERKLLADINRWRRGGGWRWGDTRGLVNAAYVRDATIAVDWLPADEQPEGFTLTRRAQPGESWPVPDYYRAGSIRQAVDLLAALGILPADFSSAYHTGRKDGRWSVSVDTNPDRRCRDCGAAGGLAVRYRPPFYTADGWECRDGCKAGARTGQRPAEPGEVCTCGRPAVTVFTGGRFGDTGYCGLPDGGQPGPCPFCAGARHQGQRCPRYELRPAGSAR